MHSFVLYTPFIKGRTTSTNSRFKYVLLIFLKISAVADKAFKIVHKYALKKASYCKALIYVM